VTLHKIFSPWSVKAIVAFGVLSLSACDDGVVVSAERAASVADTQTGVQAVVTNPGNPTTTQTITPPLVSPPIVTGPQVTNPATTPVDPQPVVTPPIVTPPVVIDPPIVSTGENDDEIRALAFDAGVTGDILAGKNLPEITDPLAQLGKNLFFTTGLGGNLEVACVSCHHPNLGGGDKLSLSVGVGAVDPEVMGPGRVHARTGHPNVPRNAPTVFNMAFWDELIFWDGRIENMGESGDNNGASGSIRTPDVGFGRRDPGAGPNLTVAQAHFPVTSVEEMRSEFLSGSDNEALRARLAARIGDYGDGAGEMGANTWLQEFRNAFDQPNASAESLINYDNIALAIGEYERSMVFVNTPFNRWVNGDNSALNEQQKRGARLFYTSVDQGGAGCLMCHDGDFFTGETVEGTAMIQIGEGKGNGTDDDFGRERESLRNMDRYKFRTPSLLNVSVTGPYGHAGAYDTLEQMVSHYSNPTAEIDAWFNRGGVCNVEQFRSMQDCATLYPNARENSRLALQRVQADRDAGSRLFLNANLSASQQSDLVEFLQSLTDPCVEDPNCMRPWVATPGSNGFDGMQLNGVDANGRPLAQ